MTSRERVDAILRKKKADRVALMDSPWDDALSAWVKDGYPVEPVHRKPGETIRLPDTTTMNVIQEGDYPEPVAPWKHFRYDMADLGGLLDTMPERGKNDLLEETDEWEVRRNGAGGALKYWKNKSGTPEHIDFLMTSRKVWDRDYRSLLLDLDPLRVEVESARKGLKETREMDVWAFYGHPFIWEQMRASLGDVTLYESLLLDPDWIHDIGRVYTDFFMKHYTYLFENAGVPDGVWVYEDLGYKNGLFASPEVLEKLIFPYFKELVDFFHGYDLPVIMHSCGSTAEAIPLIIAAGFDALNPMERKARGNDPFLFAERYGDRLAFVGGLDARVFESNDLACITREVTAYIEGMKERHARLVFASDHSISPNTKYASYRHALEVYREHCAY
jgi:uroporphyrinogen decarboxylase